MVVLRRGGVRPGVPRSGAMPRSGAVFDREVLADTRTTCPGPGTRGIPPGKPFSGFVNISQLSILFLPHSLFCVFVLLFLSVCTQYALAPPCEYPSVPLTRPHAAREGRRAAGSHLPPSNPCSAHPHPRPATPSAVTPLRQAGKGATPYPTPPHNTPHPLLTRLPLRLFPIRFA